MAQITAFGKEIKKRLVDIERPQVWLIAEVKEKTGLYFDDSYLSKIMTGKLATPKIIQAIRDILGLYEQIDSKQERSTHERTQSIQQ